MEVAPVTSTTTEPISKAEKANTKLTGDLQSFLTLLTTQLQYQDPLDPVDSTEFTAQLAQFAAVEQGIQTNANLEKLISSNTANQAVAAIGYLGKHIVAKGDTAALVNGEANFAYELSKNADGAVIALQNEAGVTVFVTSAEITAGRHNFTWDGKNKQGTQLPDGKYKMTVNAATKEGDAIDVQTYTVGIVDGADSSGDSVALSINGVTVPLADVTTVRDPVNGA